jgi:predicted ArsR family transcriptional regulator
MLLTPPSERFLTSTRGRILVLLRAAPRTVEELAQALHLTANAVRAHVARLERDGLIRQSGVRRGAGKPAALYALAPQADRIFPKAYGPVLRALLDTLAERLPPEAREEVARAAGHRLAAALGGEADGAPVRLAPAGRAERARAVLSALGGQPEVEARGAASLIRSQSCPVAGVVSDHPEVCRLIEALLSVVAGVPVRERCDRGDPPHCTFELVGA